MFEALQTEHLKDNDPSRPSFYNSGHRFFTFSDKANSDGLHNLIFGTSNVRDMEEGRSD
jgi:hypothetical protein